MLGIKITPSLNHQNKISRTAKNTLFNYQIVSKTFYFYGVNHPTKNNLSTINAIVVEDYKMIADAWGQLLRKTGHFKDVRVLYTPIDLMDEIDEFSPALLFLDINLPGSLNGLEITARISKSHPDIKIIILSIHNEPAIIKEALKNGASGYLTKNSGLDEMELAVKKVLSGEQYLCAEIRDTI